MEKVQSPDEEVGNANKDEISVVDNATGIPGQGEDTAGNDDAEDLRETVKEKITVEAGKDKTQKEQPADCQPCRDPNEFSHFKKPARRPGSLSHDPWRFEG